MKKMIVLFVSIATSATLSPALSYAAPDTKERACPSQNFAAFLKAYQNNVDIQKTFTASPLTSKSFYPDYGEKPTVALLTAAEISFPVLMTQQEMKSQAVTISIEKKTARWYRAVTRSTGGTGAAAFEYEFKKTNGCWRLVEMTDSSA
jgi:hypothetical protein